MGLPSRRDAVCHTRRSEARSGRRGFGFDSEAVEVEWLGWILERQMGASEGRDEVYKLGFDRTGSVRTHAR